MNNGDRQRIAHIKTYCEDVADFTERFGKDFQTFTADKAYFNAVAMCVLQIGELSNALSEPFRERTRHKVPWKMIRGARNWLAHAYGEVDETVLWETAINDLPALLAFCEEILQNDTETQ